MNEQDLRLIYAGDRTMDMKDCVRIPGAQSPATAPGISGTHIHPKDTGCILSCDQMVPEEEWLWAGNEWRSTLLPPSSTTGGLAAVDVAVDEPAKIARTWSRLLKLPMLTGGSNGLEQVHGVALEEGTFIRFVPKRAGRKDDGVVAFDVCTTDTSKIGTQVSMCGVEVRFVRALSGPALAGSGKPATSKL